jgi:tyrosyl-tRNA synthetase
LVGDPSGRTIERKRAKHKEVESNVNSLTTSVQKFFKRASIYAEARAQMAQDKDVLSEPVVTSNLQWHKGINMLDFLRDIGVHARVNTMLNRERYLLFSWFLQLQH